MKLLTRRVFVPTRHATLRSHDTFVANARVVYYYSRCQQQHRYRTTQASSTTPAGPLRIRLDQILRDLDGPDVYEVQQQGLKAELENLKLQFHLHESTQKQQQQQHPPTFLATECEPHRTSTLANEQEDFTMGKKDDDKKGTGYTLKTAKGTRDYFGKDMILREEIFATITRVFKVG
jgi:hypothetical protein